MKRIVQFVENGSGWTIQSVDFLTLHSVAYRPIAGSSYIPTPKYIQNKKATINIQNKDEKCFLWSVLAALHPRKINRERLFQYQRYENELNLAGLSFPLSIKHVKKFENLNNNISINVFAYDEKNGIYPVCVTSYKKRKACISLLLLTEDDRSHYLLITDKSKLFSRGKGVNDRRKYYCDYCLHGFCAEDNLAKHIIDCSKFGMQKVVLPREDNKWLQFNSIAKMLPAPFVIYADFESYTSKEKIVTTKATHAYEKHTPSGFSYIKVCTDSSKTGNVIVYRGDDVIGEFIRQLNAEAIEINEVLGHPLPMTNLTPQEEQRFASARVCYLCDQPLNRVKGSKNPAVKDHCHLTGQ
jgi:hypothetical protein